VPSAAARAAVVSGLPASTAAAGAGGLPGDVPAALRPHVLAAAAREGVPAGLLAAQLRAESGFDPRAVSRAGAQGVAQFMPATWAGSWNPWRSASPFEPAAAIAAQGRYMRRLLVAAGGDVARALAFYNAGQGGAAGPPSTWPAETRAYVAAILRAAGLAGDDPGGLPLAGPASGPLAPRLVG
jgi:soluble lytic murein transglycosylase-like protein